MKKPHIDYPINDDTLYRLADLFKVFGDPYPVCAFCRRALCAGHCRPAFHDTECDFSSASCAEADVTGQISKRWKNHLLLPGRQPCGNHHESGSGTRYRRITHKTQCQKPICFLMEEQIGFFLCLTRASFVFIPRPVVKHHRSVCRHLHLKNPCICNIFFRHFRITLSGRKHQALKSRCFFPAYTGFPGCYPYISLLILIIKDHYDLFRIKKRP